jgi:hypothetical protein
MITNYLVSFIDTRPFVSTESASSYSRVKSANSRGAVPSPQGRGLGEGKETVDRSLGIGSQVDARLSSIHAKPVFAFRMPAAFKLDH